MALSEALDRKILGVGEAGGSGIRDDPRREATNKAGVGNSSLKPL
jgi:hypothetical protein